VLELNGCLSKLNGIATDLDARRKVHEQCYTVLMKKVFISYSYSHRHDFEEFHRKLKVFLQTKFKCEVYAFVFDFNEKVDDKELMDEALAHVSDSDLLIVELSRNSVGIGIEAGYAKAKGIPIIYLHHNGTDAKQVMNGISEMVIAYDTVEDVIGQLDVSGIVV